MFQRFHGTLGEARAAEETKWGSARGGGVSIRERFKMTADGEGAAMNLLGELEVKRMGNLRVDGSEARPELGGKGPDGGIRDRSLGDWGKKRKARCSRSAIGNCSP